MFIFRAWATCAVRSNNAYGNKNVAYKVNLRSFSVYSDYSYPLTLSNVGEPS